MKNVNVIKGKYKAKVDWKKKFCGKMRQNIETDNENKKNSLNHKNKGKKGGRVG